MAPIDKTPVTGTSFELVHSLKANDVISVQKYKSSKTGLTLVIADLEGPIVGGYFVVATEAFDDDGLPHTLEHLIFLGSEKYPFKGVLDLLANRCLASGTNAWTDRDHTCYTMKTAGSEGFLSLIPVYLDHILYPTLTDAAFTTEVHHVTGEGDDGGVVYCEMQGIENSGESRAHLELTRALYPGKCGYKSETGGIMRNLRESTSNQKVRDYHKQFYRPDNLTLIITGKVDPAEVFKVLEPVEEKILSKGILPPFTRPWQSPVPPLTETQDILVPYASDEEDNGMVYIGWRGPSAVTEFYLMSACSLLMKYLTITAVSPLQKEFVETSDPFASSVSYSLQENSESVLYFIFENVPKEKIDLIKDHLMPILKKIASGEEKINMSRMKTVIHKQKLETLLNLEKQPHSSIAFMIIGDMLYGNTLEDFKQRLNPIIDLEKMMAEPESFWTDLLQKYFLDKPSVTARGVPSKDEFQKLQKEEQERVEKQRQELGEEGMKKKAKELQEAIAANEIAPPSEMLTSCPIPSVNSINFHKVASYTTESAEQYPKFDMNGAPVFTLLDDLATNFVYLILIMDTKPLSDELRMYLPLFLETILESPVQRGDKLVPYEDIISELEADTISTSTTIGHMPSSRFHCGAYCQSSSLILKVELDKYEKGVEWLHDILYNTKFTKERLKIIATKMINDVAQAKRKGHVIVHDLMKGLCFSKESNHYANSMLRQQKFLTTLLQNLEVPEKASIILYDLDVIRTLLASPANLVAYMASNLSVLSQKCPDLVDPWKKLLREDVKPVRISLSATSDWSLLKSDSEEKSGCIVGMGCVESSFLCQTAPGITDYSDPDLPTLLLFLQYLTQCEGSMWKQIRGLGLSYGYSIFPRPNEGLLYLGFYRSTNVFAAYKEAKQIIESQLKPGAQWEETLLESARSSLIFEIIEREKYIGDMVVQSLLSYFKKVDHNYNKKLVEDISKVTKEDLLRVGEKYVSPLFDPSKCKISVVCHPTKAEEISVSFKELNYDVKIYPTLEDSFLNKW